jgi:hypothetical protein
VENAEVYIDDIGDSSHSWDDHMALLLIILRKCNTMGSWLTLKCEWTVKETDWLSYWLTPIGLKP